MPKVDYPEDIEYRNRMLAKCEPDSNHCLVYGGYKQKSGHGQMHYRGKVEYVHRLMYRFENGEIPDGMLVCHKCNNPACVRTDHLYVGTHKDNMRDAMVIGHNKGVNGRGAAKPKLTESDVIAIRNRYDSGDKIATIHRDYPQVGYHNVGCVCRRTSWRHI